jgi:hypothetical protein
MKKKSERVKAGRATFSQVSDSRENPPPPITFVNFPGQETGKFSLSVKCGIVSDTALFNCLFIVFFILLFLQKSNGCKVMRNANAFKLFIPKERRPES